MLRQSRYTIVPSFIILLSKKHDIVSNTLVPIDNTKMHCACTVDICHSGSISRNAKPWSTTVPNVMLVSKKAHSIKNLALSCPTNIKSSHECPMPHYMIEKKLCLANYRNYFDIVTLEIVCGATLLLGILWAMFQSILWVWY